MRKVKWGVIGVADIATGKVIPGMQRGELCDIAAIASRDISRAKKAAKELGIAKAYGSYEELLADPEIEADLQPAAQRAARSLDRARARRRQTRAVRKADRAQRR